jgi:diadenosine tetraphosphate (Ap4A) HIT family hydrolase
MRGGWPANWEELISGRACPMCLSTRPERDRYGVRVHTGPYSDAYLQRAGVQHGYTLVIWRGRHVTEPTELTDAEAAGYWAEVLTVARAVIAQYGPLKLNYETLGNTVPHLHTHLIPRYVADPAPGAPFPLMKATAAALPIPDDRLEAEAAALRDRIGTDTQAG